MIRYASFKLANFLMIHKNESHKYRINMYYILQLLISQVGLVIFIAILHGFIGIFKEFVVVMMFFWTTKLFVKTWHASSYFACGLFSTTLILTSSIICSKIGMIYGLLSILSFNLFSNWKVGRYILDNMSKKIDILHKKAKRSIKCLKLYLKL